MGVDTPAQGLDEVHSRGDGLFLLMAIALIVVVFINTSVGYLPSSPGGLSFTALTRRLFWVILLLSLALSARAGLRIGLVALAGAAGLVLFRVLSGISPSTLLFLTSYRLCYSLVIALAAAVVFHGAPRLYYGFLKTVIYAGVPFLLLQLLGVSEAVHTWNSLFFNFGGGGNFALSPTLLVAGDVLAADYRQLRPPGVFYANSVSAVFVTFAIAFRLSRPIRRVTLYDLLLVYSTLLMMAKVTILFMGVAVVLRYLVAQERRERRAVLRLMCAGGAVFVFHWLLFPGVFETMLSSGLWVQSVMLRVYDQLISLGITAIPSLGLDFVYQAELNGAGYDSGQIAGRFSQVRLLVALVPLLAWLGMRLRRTWGDRLPAEWARRSGFLLLATVFTLLASPVLGVPLVALLVGPALVPFLGGPPTGVAAPVKA